MATSDVASDVVREEAWAGGAAGAAAAHVNGAQHGEEEHDDVQGDVRPAEDDQEREPAVIAIVAQVGKRIRILG